MCGRFSLSTPPERLAEMLDAREAPGVRERFRPSFNIAPTTDVVGLATSPPGNRVLELYRWGLVPPWARDPSVGSRLFNARAESLADKPAFADALSRRRLVLIADGFFEWRSSQQRQRRQPLFFYRADGAPLLLAGLWESWRDPSAGAERRVLSCSMITTTAGPDLASVHDRMPAILEPDALAIWLDPTAGDDRQLEGLLLPAPVGTLSHHPVDPRVGDVRNDDPGLVAPLPSTTEPEPLRLFT